MSVNIRVIGSGSKGNCTAVWTENTVMLIDAGKLAVRHIKSVLAADLSYPIILDEDGEIMDGRHRVMKALIDGEESIRAVRFSENPAPCSTVED